MKTIIKAFLTFIGVFFLFYLLGCFAQASLDINKWSDIGRETTAFLGGFISLVATVVIIVLNLED